MTAADESNHSPVGMTYLYHSATQRLLTTKLQRYIFANFS